MTRYRFELAGLDDDAALRRLMAQTPMKGSVALAFQREPHYFAANCVLGTDHQTLVCRDLERNEVVGLGTRSVRELFVDRQPKRVGYLSGLRIAEHARNRGLLARGYSFLRQLHDADPDPPDYYLTTIAEKNTLAIEQLTSGRAGLPGYHPLSTLHTLVLPIRKTSLVSKTASRLNCDVAPAEDLPEVLRFLNATGAKRTFFPRYQSADFQQPDCTFRGLTTSSIVVVRRNDQIVGAAGIWSQRAFRQTVVSGYAPAVRLLRPLLNVWSQVAGGIQLPKVGGVLEAAFVCFPVVASDDPAVFRLLLQQLIQMAPTDTKCLLIGLCEHDPLLATARALSRSEYTTTLYAVNWRSCFEPLVARCAGQYYLEAGCL